jgi:hypothetical protein
VGVTAGFHHRLVRVPDCVDVFRHALSEDFRLAGLYCVGSKGQQHIGNLDVGFGAVDRISLPAELGSFFLKALEAFVVLGSLQERGTDGTGSQADNHQN